MTDCTSILYLCYAIRTYYVIPIQDSNKTFCRESAGELKKFHIKIRNMTSMQGTTGPSNALWDVFVGTPYAQKAQRASMGNNRPKIEFYLIKKGSLRTRENFLTNRHIPSRANRLLAPFTGASMGTC